MGNAKKRPTKQFSEDRVYPKFSQLNGEHPWKKLTESGHVDYQVRELRQGSIGYFNFNLAKEMGLIPKSHADKMNRELKSELLSTFSIRIINEFDAEENIIYHPKLIKKNSFMATRYLQLQHENKLGETSGDGRCIWNGTITHKKTTWDVSSRGTGVTSLAPGSVTAKKPLETGNIDHGYGCGLAEIDELYSSAIMSEIFHNRGIPTERMLTIIDLGNGYGIGVRAGHNLFRPAHLFRYLKKGQHLELKAATDYLIQRQCSNGDWDFNPTANNKYELMLNELVKSFAHMLARLDREYIFMWLDWDGDNVLIDAGVIDYGSIRQFGLRHDQYRYDDDDRFSTNLNEQYTKGQLIVQVFIQMVDFLRTGKKRPLSDFKNHKVLKKMKKLFKTKILEIKLGQLGFSINSIDYLLANRLKYVQQFYSASRRIEGLKSHRKLHKVDDGVNRPALFDIKKAFQLVTDHYLSVGLNGEPIGPKKIFNFSLSSLAKGKDRILRPTMSKHFQEFERQYRRLLKIATTTCHTNDTLSALSEKLNQKYSLPTLTGNGLIYLVDELLNNKSTGASQNDLQNMVDFLVLSQSPSKDNTEPLKILKTRSLEKAFLELIEQHKNSI